VSVRFIHTADWQLGMTRHFLSEEAQARFSQARIDAIRTIGGIARETGAAFVVVSGDVFETNRVDPRTVRRALEALAEVPVPVFLLPGNHDPLDAGSVFRSPTFLRGQPSHVTVLEDATPREVAPGVAVIGAPWTSKRPLRDLVAETCAGLEPAPGPGSGPGTVRILVAHGATDDLIALDDPAAIRLAAAEAAIAAGRIAYLALGDRHSTTDVGLSGRVWYAGAPEPTDYDELDPGNVLLVDIGDDGSCAVTKRPSGTWRFVRERFDLDGRSGIDDVSAWLEAQPAKDRTIVKLTLVGTLSLSADARLHDLLEHHRDLFAAIEEWERHMDLVVRPDDDDFADLALTGFAQTAVDELRARAAAGGDHAQVARDALALLVRFARAKATAG
jgi:DNA repair exonuclease SbcCD nuclease subunit